MIGSERYYKKIDWKCVPTAVMGDKGLDEEYEKLEQWSSEALHDIGFGLSIEIGSFWGRSTAILAQFFDVMAIDLWGTQKDLTVSSKVHDYDMVGLAQWGRFITNMKELKLIDFDKGNLIKRVFPICSTSRVLDILPNVNAVLCHIDADHTYPSSFNDIVRCSRHITSGGFIIVHDYKRPGWGYPELPGEERRSKIDLWKDNATSVDMFLKEKSNFEIYEHFRGYVCLRRKG